MDQQDSQLLLKVQAKDHLALAEYLEQRRPQLIAFIERKMSDGLRRKVEPDDILQEVSMGCFEALGDVNLTDRDPFPWLCQMAERRIIDAHRRFFGTQKREAARELPIDRAGTTSRGALIDLLVASITSPSQAFSRDQKEMRLLEAIQSLPHDNREALRLRYVEGLPTKEIATRLQKSDVAVRVMLTRSIGRLQQMLQTS